MANHGAWADQRIPDCIPTTDIDRSIRYADVNREELLGRGGIAAVYRATLTDSDAVIALKEPQVGEQASDFSSDRFLTNAETWARIDAHDSIVTVLEYSSEPTPWLALEYMDGKSLVERESCSTAQALWIGSRIADALHHAHRHGVAHLDLKPANVLFRTTPGGTWDVPKVSDWGVARVLLERATEDTPVTPRYAAPEHFEPATYGSLDEVTDIYQLGLVLYELLTGEVPSPPDPTGPPDAIRSPMESLPTDLDPALSTRVDAVLGRALAPEKTERYETMIDFRRDITRLLTFLTDRTDDGSVGSGTGGVGPALAKHNRAGGDERWVSPETQGFVELDDQYFSERSPGSPLQAWQSGFSLSDVHAGYATKRSVERGGERVTFSDMICDRLERGTDIALLGPPGCGKSTVCKSVACAWYERDCGPVFYREGDRAIRFDRPDVLRRAVQARDGHTLIVVEDTLQPDALAVFDFMWSVDERSDVTVLLDSRTSDWRDQEAGRLSAKLNAYRHESVETVHLPRLDQHECDRFVQHFESVTGTRIETAAAQLMTDVQAETVIEGEQPEPEQVTGPDELLLLVHRLITQAKSRGQDDTSLTTGLKESVKQAYETLQTAGRTQTDVGVLTNLLNAAGVRVTPDLLYALAVDGKADAVEEAIDLLNAHVLLRDRDSRDSPHREYSTVHEAWSVAFLAHVVESEGDKSAHERVARCINSVIATVTDAANREHIDWIRHGETPALDELAERPIEWVEQFITDVFTTGCDWPKLAPMFGRPGYSRFELPDGCSHETVLQCAEWRGTMYLKGGWYDRASEAFEQFHDRVEAADFENDVRADRWRARALWHLARTAWPRGEFELARTRLQRALAIYRDIEDPDGESRCLKDLGIVARKQGEYDRAEELQQQSLQLIRHRGETLAKARRLNELGAVAWSRGEYETAEDWYQKSLSIRRDTGDRAGVRKCLTNLGVIDFRRGEYDAAERRFRRSLTISEELGDRHSETESITNLGLVEMRRGNFAAAKEYFERALEQNRDFGDTQSVANCLNNLGSVAERHDDLPTAKEYYRRSLTQYRDLDDRDGEALTLRNLGKISYKRGDLKTARTRLQTSLEMYRDMGDKTGEAACLYHLGIVARKRDDLDQAETYERTALEVARDIDDTQYEGRILTTLGAVHIDRAEYETATEYLSESLSLRAESHDPAAEANCHIQLGRLALSQTQYEFAATHLAHAESIADEIGDQLLLGDVYSLQSRLARRRGALAEARNSYERAINQYRAVDSVLNELEATRAYVDLCLRSDAASAGLAACETGLHLARQQGFENIETTLEDKREQLSNRLDG